MNKNKTKNIIITFLMLLISINLFASGSKETIKGQEEDKTLNIYSLQFRTEENLAKHMAEEYMNLHPDVKVTVEEYPWDSYFQNIEVRFAAENPDIDIVIMDIPMLANYAERGYIKDLSKYISKETFEEKIAANSLASVMYKNKIMASPMQNSDQYLFINAKMAKEAGIELPKTIVDRNTKVTNEFANKWGNSAWTWEETINAAKKMTKDIDQDGITDIYGLHIEQAGRLYQLQPLGGSKGAKIVSPDGSTVKGYLDQPQWYQAVQFYSDLFNKYKVEVPGAFIPGYDSPVEFINGSFAMMIGGGWNIKRIFDSGMDVVIAAHPYFKEGIAKTPTGSWVMGISSSVSEEKMDLASDFVSWWTLSNEGSKLWYDIDGELPASKYMLNQLSTNPKYDQFPLSAQRLGVYQVLNTAEGRPVTPYYPFINDGFDKAFTNAAQGVDTKKALNDAINEIEKNIKRVQ